MRYFDEKITDSALSDLVVEVVKKFSTRKPLLDVLADIFNTIGMNFKILTEADVVTHVFVNTHLLETGQCHRLICRPGTPVGDNYKEFPAKLPIPELSHGDSKELWKIQKKYFRKTGGDSLLNVCLPEEISLRTGRTVWVSQFDISRELPLGQFCITWFKKPAFKSPDLYAIQQDFWNLAGILANLLKQYFQIDHTTYFPSYHPVGSNTSAVLFADIRNSTPLFEIARLGGDTHLQCVKILLKLWLEYSDELISKKNIGYIHGFAGDGFMATFSGYAIDCENYPADRVACTLALHAAGNLVKSFECLYKSWRNHEVVKNFYLDHNEDVELALGIGINYGEVIFDYVGSPIHKSSVSEDSLTAQCSRPSEYAAIGDHVNTTERLQGIASKPAAEVSLNYRGEKFCSKYYLSPIIVSQTIAYRLMDILKEPEEIFLKRRGIASLKGKGVALPFYEIAVEEIRKEVLAVNMKNIFDGHYFDCVNEPPDVQKYVSCLVQELDKLK